MQQPSTSIHNSFRSCRVKARLHGQFFLFVAQLDAIFVARRVASSFKYVRNFGDIAATKSQVVYTRESATLKALIRQR